MGWSGWILRTLECPVEEDGVGGVEWLVPLSMVVDWRGPG